MKIDLHCHTRKAKSGDSNSREINEKTFRTSVLSAGVKIVAITNHNLFDFKQYQLFVSSAGNDFQVWPGIELDVKGESTDGHVIVVNNPNSVVFFRQKVEELIGNKHPDDVLINIDELISFFNELDAIILPHYLKSKSLDEKSIEKIRNSVRDSYRFFYEPSTYRTMGILINHNQPSLTGSDVKDWSKYADNDFAELKLDVDTFDQFILLAKKDSALVETLLNRKNVSKIDIGYKGTGKNKHKSVVENVYIYDDINIVFGTKGTGKTNVLEQIRKYYTSKNIGFSYYTPNLTDDEINSKLKVEDSERMLAVHSLDNCFDEFKKILSWEEASVTQLKDFIGYSKSRNVSKNKEKLKILNTNIYHNFDEKGINEHKRHRSYLEDIFSRLKSIEIERYLDEDEINQLHTILNKVDNGIYSSLRTSWIEFEAKNYSNYTIDTMKNIVEAKTETKTKPSKTGLFDFVNNRLELMLTIDKICKGFETDFSCSPLMIGKLEENKILYMVTRYRMLCLNSRTDEFKHNITALREVKNKIFQLKKDLCNVDFNKTIGELCEYLVSFNISSLDDFLGVKKVFTLSPSNLNEIEEYTPSTGEATMIILQEKLNDNKDVFILDEPEKSLGNTYVNEIIVPKLIRLAKSRKVVVVATHNANIAVRTFPYTSILKTYQDGKYKTFVGNPFIDRLVQIGNEENCLNWKEESIKILEGGPIAFDERGEIYGRK